MKYKILARIIRAFLMFFICLVAFTCIMDTGSYLFNTKRYIPIGGGKLGDIGMQGIYLPIGISVSIPDTSIWYKNGNFETRSRTQDHDFKNSDLARLKDSAVIRKVTNTLVVYDKENEITVDNEIRMNGTAQLKFHSKNKFHNAFWFFYSQVKIYAIILLLISLIKLINIYLAGDFLKRRSFMLISLIGVLLVSTEVFELLCVFINGTIIPNVTVVTEGLNDAVSSGGVNLSFNFGGSVSFLNMGIGIMIIILAKIIKDAVLIKQENDLTI